MRKCLSTRSTRSLTGPALAVAILSMAAPASADLSCETLSWLDAAVWTGTGTAPENRRRLHTLFLGIDTEGVAAELATALTRSEASVVVAFLDAIDPRISATHPSLPSIQRYSRVLVGRLECDPDARPLQPGGTILERFQAAPTDSFLNKLSGLIVIPVRTPSLAGVTLAIVLGLAVVIAGVLRILVRRQPSARYVCNIPVELDTPAERLAAVMTDISLTGCKLRIATPPELQTSLTFRAFDLKRPAIVSWSTISAVGLHFDPSLEQAEIDALLDRSRGEAPADRVPDIASTASPES